MNNQSFIMFTGLDVVLRDAAVRKGKLRSLDPAGFLCLVLGYTRIRASLFAFQMVNTFYAEPVFEVCNVSAV
jgi:hypothetical protein